MPVKIRLQRHGSKKRPFYFIVVADARSPRDGKYIQKLGTYFPNFVVVILRIMINYHSIGKLVANFGVKGEVVLHHHLGKKTSLKGLETVFIEQKKDEMLSYFIEATRIKSDEELFVKFEG